MTKWCQYQWNEIDRDDALGQSDVTFDGMTSADVTHMMMMVQRFNDDDLTMTSVLVHNTKHFC